MPVPDPRNPTAGPGKHDVPPTLTDTEKWRAFAAIGLSFVTVVMAMSMVFVALDPIADDFGVSLRAVGWVVIVESLIITALLLPLGRISDTIGRKRTHVAGLVLFGLGAALVALAPTFGLLIAARIVMAVGSAMVQSVGTAMVVAVFPPHERGLAIGSQTTAVSIGAASGPILGGLLLQVVSWNVLFLLLVVPVAISLVAALRILDDAQVSFGAGQADAKFDGAGAVVSAIFVIALVVTVSNPWAVSWLSVLPVVGAIVVVGTSLWFVRIELRHPAPMLDLRLFAIPAFGFGIAARIAGFAANAFVSLLTPIYLISVRGYSTGAAGGILFLTSFGMGLAAQISGRTSDRIGIRPLTVTGFVLVTFTAGAFATLGEDTSLLFAAILIFGAGFSLGIWNVPNNSGILGSVPSDRLGVTGAFTNLTRTLGNVLGQALAAAVVVGVMVSRDLDVPLNELSETEGASAAFMDGWQIGFVIAAVLSVGGVVLSWFGGRSRAATGDPALG